LFVEHLARIAKVGDMDAGLFEILFPARQTRFVIVALVADSARKVEDMEFGRGMAQEMSEVAETFGVF
jgi:hypothetical protein